VEAETLVVSVLTKTSAFDPSLYSNTKIQNRSNGFLNKFFLHCGVMKFLADMPSRLGGGDNRINAT
jgi:hypothetical protein